MFLWCFPHCADMLVCAKRYEYETCHTNFRFPTKNQTKQTFTFLYFFKVTYFFYTRAMNGNNLISWAYLQFISNLQNSGILHTSSMIKVIPDSKHVAIPSKVIPLVYINPSFLVVHNLLKSSIGYLNILRHSTTPLAHCTLATLSLNISHWTVSTKCLMVYSKRFKHESRKFATGFLVYKLRYIYNY